MGRTGAAAREHVTFMQPSVSTSGAVRSTTYSDYATVGARVSVVSPGELIRSEKVNRSRRFVLRIRPLSALSTTWRVSVRGTTCNVVSVEPIDARSRWHDVACEEVTS